MHSPYPHSPSYEKSVLSNIFNDMEITGQDELTPEHFHIPAHRVIFKALEKAPIKGLLEVTQEMTKTGELDKIGGPGALTEIYTFSPTSAHFSYHVKQLHLYKSRRHAITAAYELIESATDTTDDETFVTMAGAPMTLVSDLASAAGSARSKKVILRELMEKIEGRINGTLDPMGWKTNLHTLDKVINGFHPQMLYVISGFPTSGKTVLAIQILWNFAINNTPSLMLSLEMPDHKIAERNLIMAAGLDAKAISEPIQYAQEQGNAKPSKENLIKMQRGIQKMLEYPIHFEDPTGSNINQLIAIIRRNVKEHGIKVVAVDYIQLIRGAKKTFSKEQEIAEISHTFQALAKELGIAIILLSQQNKDGDTKHSQAITEDADAIFTIVQKEDDQGVKQHIGIGVKKDRHNGNTGAFLPITLNKQRLLFQEIPYAERLQSTYTYFN